MRINHYGRAYFRTGINQTQWKGELTTTEGRINHYRRANFSGYNTQVSKFHAKDVQRINNMRLQEGDHNWRSNWGLAAIGDDHNWRSARFLGVTQNGSHTAVGAVMTAGVSARRFE